MTRGKRTCKILKEIRQQIADNNDIEYVTSECHFQGECKGTCPKCEAEVKYLENELNKRRQLGNVVTIAGISLGVVGGFSGCNIPKQNDASVLESEHPIEILATGNFDSLDTDAISISPILGDIALDGIVETLPKDTLVPIEIGYEEGEIIEGLVYIEDKKDNILIISEIPPEFPGGMEALQKFVRDNIIYPEDAKEKGIEGRIIVGFVIETDGSLTNIEILRGKNPDLEAEALRVVKMMPKWKPGEQRGKKVRMLYNLPIQFTLDN